MGPVIQEINLLSTANPKIDLPAGKYAGLHLLVVGTAKSTKTFTTAMLGTLKINHKPVGEIGNVTEVADIIKRADRQGGYIANTSTTGGAISILIPVSFRHPKDKMNVLEATKAIQQYSTQLSFSGQVATTLADTCSDLTLTVVANLDPNGVASYIPYLKSYSASVSGASTMREALDDSSFVQEFYLSATTNVTQVRVVGKTLSGEEVELCDNSLAVLQAISDETGQLEATSTLIELCSNNSPSLRAYPQTNVAITTSGASTIRGLIFGANPIK